MEKTRIISAALIALGLIIGGAMLPLSVSRLKSYDRTVDVKGLCEREVMADKCIWPVCFKAVANEYSDILSQMSSNNGAIVKFLKEQGFEDSEISIATPKISDKFAQEYGGNDRVYRYLGTGVVTVCTKNVDLVLAANEKLSELMSKGIALAQDSYENQIVYNFEGLNEIKPEMIEEATRNAREAAEKFAKDSSSRLGKIKNASQGTFSIESRDSNTPFIKKVRVVTYVTYYLKK